MEDKKKRFGHRPDFTQSLNGMHPWLRKGGRGGGGKGGWEGRGRGKKCGELDNCSQQFILETLAFVQRHKRREV